MNWIKSHAAASSHNTWRLIHLDKNYVLLAHQRLKIVLNALAMDQFARNALRPSLFLSMVNAQKKHVEQGMKMGFAQSVIPSL